MEELAIQAEAGAAEATGDADATLEVPDDADDDDATTDIKNADLFQRSLAAAELRDAKAMHAGSGGEELLDAEDVE